MADFSTSIEHLVNDLEAVTERAFPVIGEIKRLLLAHGAAGAMMSGSGSTVFGLFADPNEPLSARSALCNNHPQSKTGYFMSRVF
jgi:4-diphosphocytidyl-2-C-methyl-D-erythritol kinase